MAIIEGATTGHLAEVDAYLKGQRISSVPRGAGYGVASVTGTIAAALGANSSVFAARLDPSAPAPVRIQRIGLSFVTIVAFTTPLTAGRRLSIYRGSGAAASGGTALAAAAKKDTADGLSQMNSAESGDMRIATTGALTVTGITFESQEMATMLLVGQGAAGALKKEEWFWDEAGSNPFTLRPGELVAVRNPAAMDAAGTWQLAVEMEWVEIA